MIKQHSYYQLKAAIRSGKFSIDNQIDSTLARSVRDDVAKYLIEVAGCYSMMLNKPFYLQSCEFSRPRRRICKDF